MTPPSSRRKCINILRWCYLQSHKTPTLNSLFKDSFRKNFSTYLRKRDPVFFFFPSFKLPSVPSPYMLNAYGKNYRYMIVCMLQSSEPVFFLFLFFFFFFHFGLCVCVCVCVYVLMKNIFLVIHYSAHPMVFFTVSTCLTF